jgi:hypothetical protein
VLHPGPDAIAAQTLSDHSLAGILLVLVVAGCGSAGPTVAQLRQTVNRYLTANTAAQRCALYTTAYRTMNPGVLLAGGCEQFEQLTPAAHAALRKLRIAHIAAHGTTATVALTAPPSGESGDVNQPALVALDLAVEPGQWRIGHVAHRRPSATGAAR